MSFLSSLLSCLAMCLFLQKTVTSGGSREFLDDYSWLLDLAQVEVLDEVKKLDKNNLNNSRTKGKAMNGLTDPAITANAQQDLAFVYFFASSGNLR